MLKRDFFNLNFITLKFNLLASLVENGQEETQQALSRRSRASAAKKSIK